MKRFALVLCLALVTCLVFADNVTTPWEAGVAYVDAGARAVDNYDGDITAKIVTTSAVDVMRLGSYLVTYNVSDSSGNAAIPAVRTVVVADTKPPILTLKTTSTVTVTVGTPTFGLNLGATATDSFACALMVVATGTVDTSKPGTYILTFNTKDPSGNAAVPITQTVIVVPVVDTVKPIITINK